MLIINLDLETDHTGYGYTPSYEKDDEPDYKREDRFDKEDTVFDTEPDKKISKDDLLEDQRDKESVNTIFDNNDDKDDRSEDKKKVDDLLDKIRDSGDDKKNKNVKNVEKVKDVDYNQAVEYDNMLNGFDPNNPGDKTKEKLEEEINKRYGSAPKNNNLDLGIDPEQLEEIKNQERETEYKYGDIDFLEKSETEYIGMGYPEKTLQKISEESKEYEEGSRLNHVKNGLLSAGERFIRSGDIVGAGIELANGIGNAIVGKNYTDDYLENKDKNIGEFYEDPFIGMYGDTIDDYVTVEDSNPSYSGGSDRSDRDRSSGGGGSTPGTNPKPDDGTDNGKDNGSDKDPGTDDGTDNGKDNGSDKDPGTDDGSGNPIIDIFDTIGGFFTGDRGSGQSGSGSETSNIITVEGGKDGEGFNIQALAKKYSPLIIAIVLYFVYSYGGE